MKRHLDYNVFFIFHLAEARFSSKIAIDRIVIVEKIALKNLFFDYLLYCKRRK